MMPFLDIDIIYPRKMPRRKDRPIDERPRVEIYDDRMPLPESVPAEESEHEKRGVLIIQL